MHGIYERSKQAAVLLGIAPGIPISDILLVPKRPIINAVFEVIHHPGGVSIESRSLLRSYWRPKNGIEAAVIIVECPRFWHADVGQLAAVRGIHLVAVEQLDLNIYSVVYE